MGIGLVFCRVAEPPTHYVHTRRPPWGWRVDRPAAAQAMALTIFHWAARLGHLTVVIGLGWPMRPHRRGRPLSVRWLLEPLIGRARVEGPIGHTPSTSSRRRRHPVPASRPQLGFGITQIAAGLEYLGWITVNNWWTVAMIGIVTAIATASGGQWCQQGPEMVVQHQHGAGRRTGRVRAAAGTDAVPASRLGAEPRYLRPVAATAGPAHRSLSPTATGWAAGPSSTGAGGSARRLRPGCSSPGSPGAHDPGGSSARS